MLADMMPEPYRYDERARAVCLRLSHLIDALAPLRLAQDQGTDDAPGVDPNLTDDMRRG